MRSSVGALKSGTWFREFPGLSGSGLDTLLVKQADSDIIRIFVK